MTKKMINKLSNIISNLKISTYKFVDNKFVVQKTSSALVMKSLIQITSELENRNINYKIDSEYNICILD